MNNAINADGLTTPISLTIESPFAGIDTAGIDATGPYPPTAQRDSFFVKDWQTATIRIKGLTPGVLYATRFFASAPSGDRMTRYRIENVSVRLDVAENTVRTAYLTNVPATPQGELLIRVTTDDGVGFGYIGVLELTEVGNAVAAPTSTPLPLVQPALTP